MARNGLVEEIVRLPAERVSERLPRVARVEGAAIELVASRYVPWVGSLGARRLEGSWRSGRSEGRLVVDVVAGGDHLSLLTVTACPPTGWRGHLVGDDRLQTLAIEVASYLRAAVERVTPTPGPALIPVVEREPTPRPALEGFGT